MSKTTSISADQWQKISPRILHHSKDIKELLAQVEPRRIESGESIFEIPVSPSTIWINDSIDSVIAQLCIQIKNTKDLRRVLLLTHDKKSLAAAIKNPSYFFLFSDERFRVAIVEDAKTFGFDQLSEAFSPTNWDLNNPTTIRISVDPENQKAHQLAQHLKGLSSKLVISLSKGAGNIGITLDTFIGFKNLTSNIPRALAYPDFRNLQNLFKSKPAFVVGAGPSIEGQLEWLAKYQDKVLICAADTMLSPLTKAGIRPHIICSIERGPEVNTLLDSENEHPTTLLLASGVLDPSCFETYKGPASIYFPLLKFSKWFPFPRSQFGSGHSCVGLAMAAASFLGCDPIFLIGLDLCWSEKGDSHVSSVPYLDKDFYIKSNSLLNDSAIETLNRKGEPVKTNQYWSLFRNEFESWVKVSKSSVYNLSETGLDLFGAEYLSTDVFDEKFSEAWNKTDFFGQLTEAMKYDITADRLNQFLVYKDRAEKTIKLIEELEASLSEVQPSQAPELLAKSPIYEILISSILRPSIVTLSSSNVILAHDSLNSIRKYLPEIRKVIEESLEPISNFFANSKQIF